MHTAVSTSAEIKKVCEQATKDFFKQAWKWVSLVVAIMSLPVGYIFHDATASMKDLTSGVNRLNVTMGVTQQAIADLQKESAYNREIAEKIRDRMYTGRNGK